MTRSTLLLALAALSAPIVACGSGSGDGPSLPTGSNAAPGATSTGDDGGSTGVTPTPTASPDAGGAPTGTGGGTALWSLRLGGPQADVGTAIATDKAGDIVTVGTFQGTATIGGVPLQSAGQVDFFIAKYAPSGEVQWVRPFGGAGNDVATSVALDPKGNVFVAGSSDGTLTLGGSTFGQSSATGAFYVALDPYGNVRSAKAYGGDAFGTPVQVAVSPSGAVGLSGSYKGQIDLGGGPLTAAQGTYAAFVAVIGVDGTLSFAQPLGTSATAEAYGLAFSPTGQIAVAGTFAGTGTFGGAALTSAGDDDAFVATFDTTGNGVASTRLGGPGHDDALAVAYAGSNLVLAGDFSDTVDFGGGAVMSAGSIDAYVVALSGTGAYAWGKTYGGPGVDAAASVAADALGNVVLGGTFEQAMTVGGTTLTSAGDKDIFAVKLGTGGTLAWGKRFGSTEADQGAGVGLDASGAAIVTGYFRTNVDFGTGMQTSAGDDDAFVAAYAK